MNIFSKLPFLSKSSEAEEALSAEEQEAQAKAERIQWHRENVRNGPVNFKTISAGQQRRAKARAQAREIKRNYRREVKDYFGRQEIAATLRPHLQIVGLIPFVDGHEAPLHDQIASTGWIVQRYGQEIAIDGQGTGHVSFRHGDVIDALKNACRFYEVATGAVVRVPDNFAPAIALAEAGDIVEGA